MITELNRADFHLCRPLIDEKVHLEARAVVEENNPGRIFVDHSRKPAAALIWIGNNDGMIFIGDPRNDIFLKELVPFIAGPLKKMLAEEGMTWFEAVPAGKDWEEVLQRLFQNRKLSVWEQQVYRLNDTDLIQPDYETSIDDYHFISAAQALADPQLNTSFLLDMIHDSWASELDFAASGTGFCAVYAGEVVSACLTNFFAGRIHSASLATREDHRRKGIGKQVTYLFAGECFNKGLEPYWDCTTTNTPSVKTAEGAGFYKDFTYRVYSFPVT
ncbi:GNAT family N-acetyltransferase [Alteribacter lacisalsi]|uniref:GNAT family N-acetyltransferase n=1 Tax=Alteribacter lacisalsi TaxID=2045244 RepID=A0A2W0HKJ8_9BACI|nr:GNAT family N-acetyltransferase [Alteribacter lacisalsi]PYZ97622.1 GNAT family N-acetyltransferase [Alteribacter lacisalsi]